MQRIHPLKASQLWTAWDRSENSETDEYIDLKTFSKRTALLASTIERLSKLG